MIKTTKRKKSSPPYKMKVNNKKRSNSKKRRINQSIISEKQSIFDKFLATNAKKHVFFISITLVMIFYFGLTGNAPLIKFASSIKDKTEIINSFIFKYISEEQKKIVTKPLTLTNIFSKDHSWTKNLHKDKTITLIATGDVIPARMVNYKANEYNNFKWPYEKTANVVSDADITLINLESPIFEDCQPTMTGMSFCGSSKHVEGFKLSGFDIANFANNHMGNYGKVGVEKTKKILSDANISATGINGAVYKEVKGAKVAFLGYNNISTPEEMISWADEEKIRKEIVEAKQKSNIVVVSFHWGEEYVTTPDENQKKLGRLAIDSGADLVIGNHPHWIKPVEIYKGKLITYAHGNFVFDQMWSEKTREGVIGKYTFYEGKLVDAKFTPIVIEDYGQPNFPDKERSTKILEEMKNASLELTISSK